MRRIIDNWRFAVHSLEAEGSGPSGLAISKQTTRRTALLAGRIGCAWTYATNPRRLELNQQSIIIQERSTQDRRSSKSSADG